MTKKQYEEFDREQVYCECCGRMINTKNVSYKNLRLDGTTRRCNFCDWIYRHKGLPLVEGFSEEQIKYAIEFILFEKSLYINDLADELDLTIDDTINLINSIKVRGNKKYVLKSNCEYCGKEIEKYISVYLKNKHLFCSNDCYWKHKKETQLKGSESPFYNRIIANCTNCNKKIEVIPSEYNTTNQFGDNHNFCSQKCYWEYRAKYYVAEKSSCTGITLSKEHLNKMKVGLIEWYKTSDRINSKIQLKINNILDENNIRYSREHLVKYYSIDNYLTDNDLMIEVMGDYWHASPLKFNANMYGLNKTQLKDIKYDKQKHTYVKRYLNIEILYLWETDIDKDIELCQKLILKYIRNNGILENYHSFNYHIEHNELKLNDEIIIPYQDMKPNEYRTLFKK